MADEDEVDILGDFSLPLEGYPNLLDNSHLVSQNSDLLNCDYTIHPQWLLDKPSTNPDNWYEENSAIINSDPPEPDTMGHISTENCITDESGWTEKEKNLLHRGLEIFGKSSVRLSQFIGSKTASEVKYYLKNFFTDNLIHSQSMTGSNDMPESISLDVLDGNQIPASIEEVIAVVSTGFSTVSLPTTKIRTKSTSGHTSSSSYSSGKTSSIKNVSGLKQKTLQKKKEPIRIKMKAEQKPVKSRKLQKFKVRKKEKVKMGVMHKNPTKQNSEVDKFSTTREIITGKGLAVPICEGEEIVTIKNAEDDLSDVSIDVEDIQEPSSLAAIKEESHQVNQITIDQRPQTEAKLDESEKQLVASHDSVNKEIIEKLDSIEMPECEVVLKMDIVTELEKYVHADFFDGKHAKTPERYMKIRNHILTCWKSSKPNYVYKTPLRSTLKNCGDVSCISKIHYFLEQIGAINFGCEQTKYERPLSNALRLNGPSKSKSPRQQKNMNSREPSELGPRQRFKKKFKNDGEGGCTIVHGDKGEIIDTTVVNEEPVKPRPYVKKPATVKLIYCKPFTEEKPQAYSVKINLSTLILMDFHSHSYLTEVMGLVGGLWNHEEKSLRICCYEPCKNVASSLTHCDMCPISQAKASENIHKKKFDLLGWFHSHPTFAPEPSQQDLDTQQFVQKWIGYGKPCIGIIMSPFSTNAALISSPFRCWLVDKKVDSDDQITPYRFKVDVVVEDFNLSDFLGDMKRILFTDDEGLKDHKIAFNRPYFQDFSITHLEKFISSVNMHLAKTGAVNNETCDEIIEGIRNLLMEKA